MNDSEPYDVNFCYPVHELESSRLKLTPFIPSLHAKAYFEAIAPHPEAYTYIPFSPFSTIAEFLDWVEVRVRRDPSLVLFAMIDKTRIPSGIPAPSDPSHTPGPSVADTNTDSNESARAEAAAIAGIIGLLNTEPARHSTEIGLLFTLSAAQRTHATTHAVALLQRWCFNELRMRRIQWRSDPHNVASVRVAERMGFQKEMVRRWDRALPPGKAGVPVRADDVHPQSEGLHTLYLSICEDPWQDWEGRVQEIMDQR